MLNQIWIAHITCHFYWWGPKYHKFQIELSKMDIGPIPNDLNFKWWYPRWPLNTFPKQPQPQAINVDCSTHVTNDFNLNTIDLHYVWPCPGSSACHSLALTTPNNIHIGRINHVPHWDHKWSMLWSTTSLVKTIIPFNDGVKMVLHLKQSPTKAPISS